MPALTGLRGLAALWVLVYHAWAYLGPQAILIDLFGEEVRAHVFLSLGWSGVQMLFVLSGFLLTLPYVRANEGLAAPPKTAGYFLKRISRVFPAYYLQLFLIVFTVWWMSDRLIVSWDNLVQYLLMLFVPPPIGIGAPSAVNGVWWTLPIELSFYLCLPLLAGLASWNRKILLISLCMAVMLLWRYLVLNVIEPTLQLHVWAYQLPGSMDAFGLGMLGAIIHVHYTELVGSDRKMSYERLMRVLAWLTPFVFTALGMWMAADHDSYWLGGPILYGWSPAFGATVLVVILHAAQSRGIIAACLSTPVLFYLGMVSYGLYLWHAPIGGWLVKQPFITEMSGYGLWRLLPVMFIATLFAATVSWYLVEARSIRAARSRRRPTPFSSEQ